MSRFAWKLVLSWRCCAQQECVLKLVCFTVVGCHLRCCHVELAASWEGLPCYAYPCPCFVPCGTIWWPFRWWWRVQPRLLETIWLEKRWLEKWWLEERRLEKRRLEKRRLEKRILARLEKKTEWLVQPGQRSFFLAQKGTHRSRIRSVAQRSAEGVFATDGGEKGNNTSSSSSNSYRDTFGAGCPQDVACQETCWAGEEWGEEKANPKTTHAVYGFEFQPAECLGSYAASKGYKSVCLGQLSMWSWKFWWEHGDLQRCSSYVSETRWTSSAKLSSMAWKKQNGFEIGTQVAVLEGWLADADLVPGSWPASARWVPCVCQDGVVPLWGAAHPVHENAELADAAWWQCVCAQSWLGQPS